MTSGDIMCLWSPVVTRHLQTGEWSSNDPNTLVLDPSINLALVVGNREATVLLTHSLHSHVPLRLQVLPVAEVALHHEMTYFTNGMEGSVQRIGVVLRNRIGPTDKWNNLVIFYIECDTWEPDVFFFLNSICFVLAKYSRSIRLPCVVL